MRANLARKGRMSVIISMRQGIARSSACGGACGGRDSGVPPISFTPSSICGIRTGFHLRYCCAIAFQGQATTGPSTQSFPAAGALLWGCRKEETHGAWMMVVILCVLLHVRPLIVAFEWHLCAQLPMEVPDLSKMNLQRTFVCVGPLCLRSGVGLMAGIGCGAGLGVGFGYPVTAKGSSFDSVGRSPLGQFLSQA